MARPAVAENRNSALFVWAEKLYNAVSFLLPDALVGDSGVGIAVTCQGCQARLNVRDDMAGAKGKCPKCGASLRIPSGGSDGKASSNGRPILDQASPAVTPSAQLPASNGGTNASDRSFRGATEKAAMEAAFQGHLTAVAVSAGYRAGVFVVACCLAALTALYFCVVVAAFLAVGWYAFSYWGELAEGSLADKAVYLGIIALGLGSAVLLAKTVIAPAASNCQEGVAVDAVGEPLLFEFVERVAREVGARPPPHIYLNCDVYVAASPPRGWRAPFGRKLVLTIGLPLVEGLTLQEFGGALAHELALFTRASGKRRAYIIRTISEWFQRIATERDAWDQSLLRTSHRLGVVGRWLVAPLRIGIWLTRWIPWLFMVFAHALAGYYMRQMELNADRYQIRLAGSAAFENVCKRRILLQYALRGAQSDLEMCHRAGALPDDLPRFVVATAAQQPAEVRQTLLDLIDRFQTGPFDPRPGDKERIAAARAERSPGVLHSDLPATSLFADFTNIARQTTRAYYALLFGSAFRSSSILPVENLIDCRNLQERASEARKRFFLGAFGLLRPVRLPSHTLQPPASIQLVQAQLQHQREQMHQLAAAYAADYALYAEADNQLVEAGRAVTLFKAGLNPRADLFSISFVSIQQARDVRTASSETLANLTARMEGFEWAAGQRLHAALTLLQSPEVAARAGDAGLRTSECERLLMIVSSLTSNLEDIYRLRTDHARLTALVEHARGTSPGPTAMQELQRRTGRVFRELQDLHRLLEHLEFPFPQEQRASVAKAVLATLPAANNLQAVVSKTTDFLDNVIALYGRCIDRLCSAAEAVEAALASDALSPRNLDQHHPA